MSRLNSPRTSGNIPLPPPLPPPLKPFSVSEPIHRSSTKKSILSKRGSLQEPASPKSSSQGQSSSTDRVSRSSTSSKMSSRRSTMVPSVIHSPKSLHESPRISSPRDLSPPEPEIVRNDVPFFDEDACVDSEDEYSFPCCVPPYSSRYPPNPRPQREWDPIFLPGNTNIPESIGTPCRRCGRQVHLAELHLSSRGAYHTECFICCLCGKSLDSWSMEEFKGEVFCKGCYRRNFGTHGCGFGVGAGVLQTP